MCSLPLKIEIEVTLDNSVRGKRELLKINHHTEEYYKFSVQRGRKKQRG